jgi:tetratricopeptide (TPR) repeat protein
MANKEVHEQLYSCATGAHWNIQVSDEIRQKFSDLAKRAIKDQIDATPDDSRSYYFAGTYLNRIGQMGEAEGLLMRAHALSPRKQIFSFALAENFIFQKDFDQALAILKQAYESATSYEKAALAYAMGLEIAGNSAEAHNIALIDEADKQTLGSIGSYMKGNEFNKAFVIFRGAISTSRDVNFLFQQAQMEYGQGMKDRAINTLREIEIINPVWKSSIEETIKGMQK